MFGIVFVGYSYPIAESSFARIDATHWVLDVVTTLGNANYAQLEEVGLFLVAPGAMDETAALALYISVGGQEWQYRGYVTSTHPSEVMPLKWPELPPSQALGPGVVQLAEVAQKEGIKVATRAEFAKRVALDLYRFMESFSVGSAGNQLVLPTDVVERWFKRFEDKLRRDKDWLAKAGL